jgi:O-antigen ligase
LAVTQILSVATVFVFPKYGVTGAFDIYGVGEPGLWRGLFGTKNVLGHVSGIAFGAIVIFGRRGLRSSKIWGISILASAACLVGARSSSGFMLAAALPLTFVSLVKPKGIVRLFAGPVLLYLLVLAAVYAEDLSSLILRSLGRDASLSGRTEIWYLGWQFASQYWATGAGFSYTSSPAVVEMLTEIFAIPHFHNAFLSLLVDVGYVNAATLALAVLYGLFRAWSIRTTSSTAFARNVFTILVVGWLISGITEVDALRTYGPIVQTGITALLGLYSLQRPNRASSVSYLKMSLLARYKVETAANGSSSTSPVGLASAGTATGLCKDNLHG